MSYVTNVIIQGRLFGRDNQLRMRSEMNLNTLTPAPADGFEVNWGGGKMPECDVWAGAYNYFNIEDFLEKLKQYDWYLCEVFVLTPEDSYVSVYRMNESKDFEFALNSVDRDTV